MGVKKEIQKAKDQSLKRLRKQKKMSLKVFVSYF